MADLLERDGGCARRAALVMPPAPRRPSGITQTTPRKPPLASHPSQATPRTPRQVKSRPAAVLVLIGGGCRGDRGHHAAVSGGERRSSLGQCGDRRGGDVPDRGGRVGDRDGG